MTIINKIKDWLAVHKKSAIAIYSLLVILVIAVIIIINAPSKVNGMMGMASNQMLGGNYEANWKLIDKFTGYKTKADAQKIGDGDNPVGQNTQVNDTDLVSVRDQGYTIFGGSTTTESRINSLYTFRKRSGENIMLRSYGTSLEYYEEGNDTWESLGSSYSSGAKFGFADYNINTDQVSYVYFGNSIDPFSRWNGAHTLLTEDVVVGTTTVHVASTLDFPNTSGSIMICGASTTYSTLTADTFTIDASTVDCPSNRSVAQAPDTFTDAPRGNIYMTANNRLFVSGATSSPIVVYFSKYGDATTWNDFLVTTSTAASAGIFNLAEGGGGVTGMAQDEQAIYFMKRSIVYIATLSDSLYTIKPLKTFDSKSQTSGSVNPKTVFSGNNGVYFVTPDYQIMALQRVQYVDYPQSTAISDEILPTIESSDFSSSTGISFNSKAYFAVRGTTGSSDNDVVLVWDDSIKAWQSPIVGWNVGDWTIYNDGTGDELYFGSSRTANVYQVTDEALDNGLGVTANWRTKRFDFGLPHQQKTIESVYLEGYITDNTTLNVSLLLDYDGYTQTYTTAIKGTETGYVFNTNPYNMFGLNPFGYQVLGSSNQQNKKKFIVYLNKGLKMVPFYTAQIELASDGENQFWQVGVIGMKWRINTQEERGNLYRAW